MEETTQDTPVRREPAQRATSRNAQLKRASLESAHSAHPCRLSVRLRERIRHRGAARRAPGRPQLAAARAYGLYAEQLSGTAFTAPRAHNRRSWLYRVRPAAVHKPFTLLENSKLVATSRVCRRRRRTSCAGTRCRCLRADRFHRRLVTMAGNGSAESMTGCAIHLYAANRSMQDRFFYSADGELLIVPQEGRLAHLQPNSASSTSSRSKSR